MSNEIKCNKGAVVKEINGVKYFKLVSKYPGDYTKNCGLLANEIDENFFFLRSYDIQSMHIDEDRNLILTRVDGDKLVVNISEEVGYPTFEFIKEEGKIIVHYPDGTTDVMEGFLIEGQDIRVATDYTIKGDGRISNPLRISEVERTGTYAPAKEFIDLTVEGNKLPEDKGKGYRVVTKEYFTPFGCLYDYSGVTKIQEDLEGKPWRVPSRQDWADLLNAAECPEDRNHGEVDINEWKGKVAGKRCKSTTSWSAYTKEGQEMEDWVKGIDNLPSTGSFGTFHVIPVGYAEGSRGNLSGEGARDNFDIEGLHLLSSFWSITPTNSKLKSENPNIYTRTFAYDSAEVLQESSKPSSKLSLRLVKDFNFDDFNEYENILGHYVPCVLISNPELKYSKVWTAINIGFTNPNYGGVTSDSWSGLTGEDREIKEVFFINEWNGEEWVKKQMNPGDSVVIIDYDGDPSTSGDTYHEWRVYEYEDGTSELKDTAEALKEEIQKELDEINDKIDELSAKTEEIEDKLDDEIARAISAETMLAEAIDAETERAISAETILQEEIDALDEKLDAEIERAISAETILQEEIDAETERAQSAETVLQEEIDSITVESAETPDEYTLKSYAVYVNGEQRGITIDIPKDKSIKEISTGWTGAIIDPETGEYTYDPETGTTEVIRIIYQKQDGKFELTEVNIEDFIMENEFADGLSADTNEHVVRVLIDPESDSFLTVSPTGVLLSGVTSEIERLDGKDIDVDGHDLTVTEGLTLKRENGEEIKVNIDTNFGLLPKY
jgi:hypothetical protein